MPSERTKRFKKWLYALLVALGVGSGAAARCAGCESGIVTDDGECIVFD